MRSNFLVYFFMISLIFGLSPQDLFAWGEIGHKLIGVIAEDAMTDDGRAFVRGILGIEPLAVSSNWADEVRDDKRFSGKTDLDGNESDVNDFSPYHFCDIPSGYEYEKSPKRQKKDCHAIIKYASDILTSPNYPRETKMITLRFLIHVLGDIHQPLHVGNGYDRGGNSCKVKLQSETNSEGTYVTNFHSFWDTGIVELMAKSLPKKGNFAPRYYPEIYTALKQKHPQLLSEKTKSEWAPATAKFQDWMTEATEMRTRIYPDGEDVLNQSPKGEEYKFRKYCTWFVDQTKDKNPAPGSVLDESMIPLLDQNYINRFTPEVEMQLIKAGLRVAATLDRLAQEAKKSKAHTVDDSAQKNIFQTIYDKLINLI